MSRNNIKYQNKLTLRFINDNEKNECDVFTKWKWDAIIHAIETGEIDEDYLLEKKYIKEH